MTLQTALAATGSLHVPPTFGQVSAVWPDADGSQAAGHLAFAQEFFVGVEDAWRVALRAAEGGEDFTPLARALGYATAQVHSTLRRVMPTVDPEQSDIDVATQQMWRRYELAAEEVPELREYASEVERVYALASEAAWPTLQRIHGDFHLGQILAVPDRGWVFLDFEGEPLRPLDARNAPDAPARDVAGLLPDSARRILAAYELDKAIYETIYEAQYRPTWLPIPVAAVKRILGVEDAVEADDAGEVTAGVEVDAER